MVTQFWLFIVYFFPLVCLPLSPPTLAGAGQHSRTFCHCVSAGQIWVSVPSYFHTHASLCVLGCRGSRYDILECFVPVCLVVWVGQGPSSASMFERRVLVLGLCALPFPVVCSFLFLLASIPFLVMLVLMCCSGCWCVPVPIPVVCACMAWSCSDHLPWCCHSVCKPHNNIFKFAG